METYSINPNPIPQGNMTAEDHGRRLNLLMILVAVALIIGLLYWWTSINNQPSQSNSIDMRAEVAAILRNAPIHVSQQEIDKVASQLASSRVAVTESEKQSVANALKRVQ